MAKASGFVRALTFKIKISKKTVPEKMHSRAAILDVTKVQNWKFRVLFEPLNCLEVDQFLGKYLIYLISLPVLPVCNVSEPMKGE